MKDKLEEVKNKIEEKIKELNLKFNFVSIRNSEYSLYITLFYPLPIIHVDNVKKLKNERRKIEKILLDYFSEIEVIWDTARQKILQARGSALRSSHETNKD